MGDMNEAATPARWREESWSVSAFAHNLVRGTRKNFQRHPILTITVPLILLIGMYIARPHIQPLLLLVRIYFGGIAIAAAGALALWVLLRKHSVRAQTFGGAFGIITVAAVVLVGGSVHSYFAQYFRYLTLSIEDIDRLPLTDHERVLPLNAVHTLARERMNETESPTIPALVRIGSAYRWTMAIEPGKAKGRFWDPVDEVISISSTEPSPDLSRRRPEQVKFTVGENLMFSRNTHVCVRRAFGFWRSFSYEPSNVFYIQNDKGQWVQAISLIRWTGFLFPWPEFGGVQIIEQGDTNPLGRLFLGCGRWIRPGEVHKHAYLVGQNLVPYAVTRFKAESLRFQAGFTGPMWFSRQGDIRIADMPEDVNEQPFTLYFKFQNGNAKLYQYFALEPRDKDKQGLSTSLWIPADGIGLTYTYRHFHRKEAPIGVTTVADQVRASRKTYDWKRNAPVEVRPYIHEIADSKGNVAPRFGWMVTVVTIKERKEGMPLEFTSGSDPEISITDAYRARVVWVDPQRPESWPGQLRESLGSLWALESP